MHSAHRATQPRPVFRYTSQFLKVQSTFDSFRAHLSVTIPFWERTGCPKVELVKRFQDRKVSEKSTGNRGSTGQFGMRGRSKGVPPESHKGIETAKIMTVAGRRETVERSDGHFSWLAERIPTPSTVPRRRQVVGAVTAIS